MAELRGACNLRELEALARAVVPESAFGYYRSGADDEHTLAENEHAFTRWLLRPRVLVDVSSTSTRVSLLGTTLPSPVLVAPMAAQRMAHDAGELATATAAAKAGLGFCLSTLSTRSLESVAACRGSAAPQFFQIYVFRDRAVTESLLRRAEAGGYAAIVLTADAPFLGRREADVRNKFSLAPGMAFENIVDYAARVQVTTMQADGGSGIANYFVQQIDATLTWETLAWLHSVTRLPIFVKGVLTAEDAALAVQAGASGIICSNHGGRQLDGVAASIDALPEVVAAAAGRVPVLLDGGIRRGTDVLKALALGATAVLLGRPVVYGLALGGEAGVAAVLAMLDRELRLAMALAGCTRLPPPATLVRRAPHACACAKL